MSARRLLQLLLLVQAAAAGAIAWAAVRWLGAAPWKAILAGIASVALVRLAINANNFAMSARFASPTPPGFRLGLLGRLRLFGEEFGASMLQSSWIMPRASAWRRLYSDASVPPVLLLHGYGCNSGYWAQLARLLDAAHISYAALDLEPMGGDIDGYVPLVESAAEELLAASGADQLAIVAHSMGGLVARAWMRAHGRARVARIVTLGTPHHGTGLASRAPGVNARQMRRSAGAEAGAGEWLQALDGSEDMQARALITSIYSHHDNIVAPQTSGHLPGARNIEFGGVGHVALGSNRRVLAQVMRELAALAQAGRGRPPP
jgi:triacylglycerol esterase/lipase EstA (alpha/beta hydrolase family)